MIDEVDRDKNAVILLVEDDRVDIMTVQRALKKIDVSNPLHVARTGVEALGMLRGDGFARIEPTPSLILLDLNLPKKDGREVLARIKGDRDLRRIPVIVFTSSQNPDDVLNIYDLAANCFIAKPMDLEQFSRVVTAIEDFWMHVVELPKE